MPILAIFISIAMSAIQPMDNIEFIEVSGKNVNLILQEGEASHLEWNSKKAGDWEVKKELNSIHFNTDEKENIELVIQAPATKIKYFANQAQLDAKKWLAPVYLRSLVATIVSDKTSGKWDIHSQKGDIRLANHRGEVKLHLGEGRIDLKNIIGDIDLDQFAGEIALQEMEGDIKLVTQQAKTKVLESSGTLEYVSHNGEILLSGFSGSLNGKSENGMSILRPSANAKVVWRAENGGLRLGLNKMNGAYVDIATKKGSMSLVPPLEARDEGIWRVARAKLRGSEPGSVKVRTNKADIQLKFE